MKKAIILIVFLFSPVFASPFDFLKSPFPAQIDTKLLPYFLRYMRVLDRFCSPSEYLHPDLASITFGKMPESTDAGYCQPILDFTFAITFDEKYWDTLSESARYTLMAHELMHCMLDQNHIKKRGSIMHAVLQLISAKETERQMKQIFRMKCHGKSNQESF